MTFLQRVKENLQPSLKTKWLNPLQTKIYICWPRLNIRLKRGAVGRPRLLVMGWVVRFSLARLGGR